MIDKLLLVLNDCAWAYNLSQMQYVFISPNIQTVLGITPDAFSTDTSVWSKIILATDRELTLSTVNELKTDDQVELHYRVKVSGKIKWIFEKRTRFIDDTSGHEILLSVIKDVTDQNGVTHHLRNALGDFSILFDKNHSPMWIYETPSLRIIKVNNAAIEHYGYTEKEFLNMTIRDVRPKIDLAAFNEYIFRKGITKGKALGYNPGGIWRHHNKHGEIIYAEITGYEVKYNTTACRIVIVNDVTERMRFEEEKREYLKTVGLQR
jgi:PAS domain S-box-containing protein